MSTKDDTAAERRRRQKTARRKAGWDFVQVWVPSKAQGDTLRSQALEMREAAIGEVEGKDGAD